ncbi:MAG TPA: ChaN family lipoprotein, partial [Kofleriaceae bacterium]|nr:ChaN family lipoprotein [Kofleriaceae bacterium]
MTPRTRAIEGGVALGLLALASACGGGYRAATPAGGGGDPAKLGDGGGLVEAAALPYAIVDGHTGHAVADAEFWVRLGGARAVCAGEEHPSPHDHWAQLQIVDHLTAPPRGGAGLAVGMEMVQQPFQGVLDDWTGARIDDAALLSRTGWVERWGYDFAMYRPVLALARTRGAALVALNAPSEL